MSKFIVGQVCPTNKPSLIFEIGKILFVFIVCMAVYVPLNLLMKMDYASELAIRLKNKLSL